MDINAAFPSNYLKAADLGGKAFKLQIKEVTTEDVGSGEQKPILYFEKTAKGLVLNKTNAMAIAQAYGPETAAWAGQAVEVFPATTMFNGQNVPCIRLRPFYPVANGAPGALGTSARQATPSPRGDDELHDDSIPF